MASLIVVLIVTSLTIIALIKANNTRNLAEIASMDRQKVLDTAIALLQQLRNEI